TVDGVEVDASDGEPGTVGLQGRGSLHQLQTRGRAPRLGGGRPGRSHTEVVGPGFLGRGGGRSYVVVGPSDDRIGPDDVSGHRHRKVALSQVENVRTHGAGDVRAVVDGKKCPVAFTRLTEHLQRGDLLQGVQPPVPELDDVHTSGKGRVGELGEVTLLGPGIGAQVQKGCVQALTQAGSMTGPHPFHPRRVHPRGRHADKVHIVPERREEAPSRASAYDRGSGVPRHGPRADLTPDPRTSCARCRGEPHSANPWARRRTSVPRFSRMAWMGVPGRESSGVNSQRRASSWEKPESLSRTRVPGRPLTKSLPFKNAAGTDNSPLRTTPIMRFSRMSCLMWLGLTPSG